MREQVSSTISKGLCLAIYVAVFFCWYYKELMFVCSICDCACIINVWGCAEILSFSFLNGSVPDSLHTLFTVKAHWQMSVVFECRAT